MHEGRLEPLDHNCRGLAPSSVNGSAAISCANHDADGAGVRLNALEEDSKTAGGPRTPCPHCKRSVCPHCGRPIWVPYLVDDEPGTWLSEVSLHAKFRYRPFLIDDLSQYSRELKALGQLQFDNQRPDIRKEADAIASHPALVSWIEKSDALVSSPDLKGRADLVRLRRRGILRHLAGEDRGFPLFQPTPAAVFTHRPSLEKKGFWMLRLLDELSWHSITVYPMSKTRQFARPVKERLNHREARAILDWKASLLDLWLSKKSHLLEGRIALERSRGVVFDTERLMRWVYSNTN